MEDYELTPARYTAWWTTYKKKAVASKRKRKGFIYLAKVVGSNEYKYGATTRKLERRIYEICYATGKKYELIATRYSDDVFTDEMRVKWNLLNSVDLNDGRVEFFSIRKNGITDGDIVALMESL